MEFDYFNLEFFKVKASDDIDSSHNVIMVLKGHLVQWVSYSCKIGLPVLDIFRPNQMIQRGYGRQVKQVKANPTHSIAGQIYLTRI